MKKITMPENPTGKLSTLTKLLRNCVEIIKVEVALSTLYDMINHCTRGRETPTTQRMVNQVLHMSEPMENYDLMRRLESMMWIILFSLRF
jgi:hypothetical protein